MKLNRITSLIVALALALTLCACKDNTIPPEPVESTSDVDTSLADESDSPNLTTTTPDEISSPAGDVTIGAEFVGSYLTMLMSDHDTAEYDGSYFNVFTNYVELSEYYDTSSIDFFYGKKFTLECASFNDEFMRDHDVLLLKIDEPSSYITHEAASIVISEGVATFNVERHIPENAPQSATSYHLIFTAPKGAFDSLAGLSHEVEITEILGQTASANDAERYLYIYPEFWPFVYKADAVNSPATIIDSIESYNELIGFYEQYKSDYAFADDFKKHIGSLYDERMFEDYVLLMVLAPCDDNGKPLEVDQLFVYNLEVFIAVKNSSQAVVSETTPSYLLVTAVSKKDLQGVNLSVFNISFN